MYVFIYLFTLVIFRIIGAVGMNRVSEVSRQSLTQRKTSTGPIKQLLPV